MSEELKPCPFCGSRPSRSTEKATMLRSPLRVSCSDDGCGAHYGSWHPKEWNNRAELAALKAGRGEAVAVVAYLPTEEDLGIKYSSKAGPVTWFGDPPRGEHLMTVTQHERIVAAITAQPASADAVSVPRELLERICVAEEAARDYPLGLFYAVEELRALLAQSQKVN